MLIRVLARLLKGVMLVYFGIASRFLRQRYCHCMNWHVGMGNRLITLMNQYVWCGKENIHLCWGLDDWITAPFDALFEMTDAPNFRASSNPITIWSRAILLPYPRGHKSVSWRFYVPEDRINVESSSRWIDCMYQGTPQWAIEKYGHFFEQLMPSAKVLARIDSCPIPKDTVCVQIRNSHRVGDYANVSTIGAIISTMRRYDEKQCFFISAIEPDYFEEVVRAFPGRTIGLPNKDYSSIVDTVAEMWLLGQGKELICMGGSTFTEISWWWGGRRSQVICLSKDYQQKL